VRHGNRWVQARITAIDSVLDIHTLQPLDAHELAVNEIGRVQIEVQQPLPVEPYPVQPRGRRADRRRPGQPPHQRRAAGATRRSPNRLPRTGDAVCFVGAGPGAADLITLRGRSAWRRPTWCCTTR
jgi:hypothetical protein